MDCSENYEAEKNNKEKLNCCFCEFSAHGCPIFEQQKISKGYVWFCEECRELPKRINLTYMTEERTNLTNMIEEMKKKDKIKDKKGRGMIVKLMIRTMNQMNIKSKAKKKTKKKQMKQNPTVNQAKARLYS